MGKEKAHPRMQSSSRMDLGTPEIQVGHQAAIRRTILKQGREAGFSRNLGTCGGQIEHRKGVKLQEVTVTSRL